jgi:hypothetical protein
VLGGIDSEMPIADCGAVLFDCGILSVLRRQAPVTRDREVALGISAAVYQRDQMLKRPAFAWPDFSTASVTAAIAALEDANSNARRSRRVI